MFCKRKTCFTSQSIWSWVRSVYHSTQELITLSVDNDHWSRENFAPWDKKAQRILSCSGVVGADEPLRMGLSSQKSLCGLADGSKRGSGQHPEALRKICYFSTSFPSFFQLGKRHDWMDHPCFQALEANFKGWLSSFLSKLDKCSHQRNSCFATSRALRLLA